MSGPGTDDKIEGIDTWKVEDDLRTLKNSERILGEPTRLKAVNKLASQELDSLKKIAKRKPLGQKTKPFDFST